MEHRYDDDDDYSDSDDDVCYDLHIYSLILCCLVSSNFPEDCKATVVVMSDGVLKCKM